MDTVARPASKDAAVIVSASPSASALTGAMSVLRDPRGTGRSGDSSSENVSSKVLDVVQSGGFVSAVDHYLEDFLRSDVGLSAGTATGQREGCLRSVVAGTRSLPVGLRDNVVGGSRLP